MIRYQASPADTATPSPSCRTALIDRMADQMREMAFAGQTVSTETLTERGWSEAAIRRLAPDAVAKARRTSIRRLS
ncbi:hypothetical protein [Hoeflea alexandrii]|uniref:Uncharacterized protein n=1 Tax=Hoeflea alexandrii TaxID=288436 RepID=A0ABT1CV67_9HYPH|nr:hypothetical protein [Hoeflea alexandrii]MCO6410069.1 hypothetical protein [Hoeflea alexandrii]MCY0153041.1 hypothetical protein [Hoeflea alexandrii]